MSEYQWRIDRVLLARKTGWTLDTIDRLDVVDVNDVLIVWAEADKAEARARS